MVDNEKEKCWANSEEMLGWAPGCGSGIKGRMLYSADLNDGWCDGITTHISARPGALAPHCIYEVKTIARRSSDKSKAYWKPQIFKIRCLYHGAKDAKPNEKFLAIVQSENIHRNRLLRAKAALILSLGLMLFGLLLRLFRSWKGGEATSSSSSLPILKAHQHEEKKLPKISEGLIGISMTPSRCH